MSRLSGKKGFNKYLNVLMCLTSARCLEARWRQGRPCYMSCIFFLWVVIPMCRGDVDVLFVKVLNTLYLYNRSGVYASFPQRPVSLWRFSKLEKETVFIEGLFWFLKFYLESKKYKIFRVWVCMKVQIRITFNSQNRSVFSSARGNEREAGHVCTCLTLTDCSVSAGVLDYLLLFSHSAGSCSAAHGGKRAREKSQYDH